MNRRILLLSILWIGIIGLIPVQGIAGESPVNAEMITKELRETIEATRQYMAQQKVAFQRKTHEEMVTMQIQISALWGKVRNATTTAREEFNKSMNELDKKKDAVEDRIDKLRTVTDAKWHDVKAGASAVIDELRNSYQKALSYLT